MNANNERSEKTNYDERTMQPDSVAIATFTRYPLWENKEVPDAVDTDVVRGNLALETLQKAQEQRYHIFVDSSPDSSGSFLAQLGEIHATVLNRADKTRQDGILSLVAAMEQRTDIQAVMMQEPEKVGLITFVPQIMQPILHDEADIVIPMRNPYLFQQTYPDYMYASEHEANRILNKIFMEKGILMPGQYIDFMFGPLAWKNSPEINRKLWRQYALPDTLFTRAGIGKEFVTLDPTFLTLPSALTSGLRVKSIEIPFTYPYTQWKEEEFHKDLYLKKRRSQRLSIMLKEILFAANKYE